jgi:hypothetical protein
MVTLFCCVRPRDLADLNSAAPETESILFVRETGISVTADSLEW